MNFRIGLNFFLKINDFYNPGMRKFSGVQARGEHSTAGKCPFMNWKKE